MDLIREINEGVVGLQHLLEQAEEIIAWFDKEHQSKFTIKEAEEGTIEWDPSAVKEFKGKKGITTATGVAKRRGINKKDLVIKVVDGKPVGVGVVVSIDRSGIHIGNPKNPDLFKGAISANDIKPADRENKVVQRLMAKNPGRPVWVVGGENQLGLAPN